jgi:hypothetical protein
MSRFALALTQLLALAVCSMSSVALGRVVQYEEVAFSTVIALQTCGRWEVDGKFGEFRVVQAYFYGGTMLFVDMVGANDRGTWHEVFRGFTFHELNDDHLELELSDVRCSSNHINKITVSGLAEPFEREPFSFTLELDGATGRYEIKRQPK